MQTKMNIDSHPSGGELEHSSWKTVDAPTGANASRRFIHGKNFNRKKPNIQQITAKVLQMCHDQRTKNPKSYVPPIVAVSTNLDLKNMNLSLATGPFSSMNHSNRDSPEMTAQNSRLRAALFTQQNFRMNKSLDLKKAAIREKVRFEPQKPQRIDTQLTHPDATNASNQSFQLQTRKVKFPEYTETSNSSIRIEVTESNQNDDFDECLFRPTLQTQLEKQLNTIQYQVKCRD